MSTFSLTHSSLFVEPTTNSYNTSSSTAPNDLWTSELSAAKESENSLQRFSDMQTFSSQLEIQIGAKLGESEYEFTDYSEVIAEDKNSFIYNHILYPVPMGTQAAQVDSYWNANNTSQRILNFALSFRDSFSDLNDQEFYEKIENALLNGFANAKDAIGEVKGYELAQLYNDTFSMTMSGLEKLKSK
jgi:hypothetical protein